jgi:hypothetical protein
MKSFENLNKKVTEQPILALPEFNKVFKVDYDASGSTIRAILSQEGSSIAFFNENLNDAKKKYSVYDQEFYAIVNALNKWRHYFLSNEFVLFTNHKVLQHIKIKVS